MKLLKSHTFQLPSRGVYDNVQSGITDTAKVIYVLTTCVTLLPLP